MNKTDQQELKQNFEKPNTTEHNINVSARRL